MFSEEDAQALLRLVAKGVMGAGVIETDDIRTSGCSTTPTVRSALRQSCGETRPVAPRHIGDWGLGCSPGLLRTVAPFRRALAAVAHYFVRAALPVLVG